MFIGKEHNEYICRRCLYSYTFHGVLIDHRQKCGQQEITSIELSNGLYIIWKIHFHKNPIHFKNIADFEADNEIEDGEVVGNKTTKIYKQNPILNGYYKISELENVLKSGYYDSPLGYDNIDWYVNEVIKIKSKIRFYFNNTEEDIIMIREDTEDFENNKICRICEKKFESDKYRDHCHLTGKYRGPAHNTCNKNITQKQSNFLPFEFHNFSNYDCHLFFKKLVDMKKNRVKFKIIPKTNEKHNSVIYGCLEFINKYGILSSSLDKLVNNLDGDHFKLLKEEHADNWKTLNKKLAYPYD